MDNLKEQTPVTPESVLATVEAILAKLSAEFNRRSAEFDRRSAEHDKRSAEFNRRSAEFDRRSAEFDRRSAEHDQRSADFDRQLKQSRETFERELKQSRDDFDRRMKKLSEQIGGLSNNHGLFAEEYFANAFQNGKKTFFGEKFDLFRKNVPGFSYEDEYDIVLLNGQSVGIVEVKYKVHDKDIANVIRKVKSFKINYPVYRNHRFFLGLASLVFAGKVEDVCVDSGIAVIKQVGDTVVINDGHLKVY